MSNRACRKRAIAIVGSAGVPAKYGGFETLAENLLGDADVPVAIYCSRAAYEQRPTTYKAARLHYIPLQANGIQSIAYDVLSMIHAWLYGYRKLLVLGVSGAIIIPWLRVVAPGMQIITNIDGLEWKRQKWGRFAKWFLRFSEGLAVRYSHTVIADNDAIADHVLEAYARDCEVIAYGGDHAFRDVTGDKIGNYALSICRIEPENNVHLILQAFARSTASLKMVGNWHASSYGISLVKRFKGYENIEMIDPIYEPSALAAYRSGCSFYVHGHSAGGTNPSLVEIMHFAKPVLAFDCAYNRATLEGHGQYFSSVDDLLAFLLSSAKLDTGEKMAEIARRRYTWKIVRRKYFQLFREHKVKCR